MRKNKLTGDVLSLFIDKKERSIRDQAFMVVFVVVIASSKSWVGTLRWRDTFLAASPSPVGLLFG